MRKLLIGLICALASLTANADLLKILPKGATSRSVDLQIIDSTDGTKETAVAYNTSGIDLKYCREATACVDITEVTQTAGGAWTSGGFVAQGFGTYRLDVPNAALATGVNNVTIVGTVTGMVVIGGTVRLVDYSLEDAVRGTTGTSLPNAAAGASGGVLISGTNAGTTTLGALTITGATTHTGATTFTGAITGSNASNNFRVNGAVPGATGGLQIAGSNAATSYASLTADLTGNVSGDIGGIAPNGLTADAFNADTNSLFGITNSGTMQSVSATTARLASAAAFPDSLPTGATVLITSGTYQGASATCESYTASDDTCTFTAWSGGITPTGTPTYQVFGTAASSGGGGGASAADVWAYSSRTLTAGTNIDGSTFTAMPWNAAWDTEVQSEAADALNAYDPPTNAEMTARTLATASYATPTNITAGTMTNVTNLTNAPTAGDLTATMKTSVGTAVTSAISGLATSSALATLSGKVDVIDDFLDTEVAAILADTNELQTDWVNGGRLDSLLDLAAAADLTSTMKTSVQTAAASAITAAALATATNLAAVKTDTATIIGYTDDIGVAGAGLTATDDAVMTRLGAPVGASISADIAGVSGGGGGLDAAGMRAAIGLSTANLDTQLADVPTLAEMNARTLASAGYASPTNITAGVITTVTDLTNAPTSGDLTEAMKTSAQTAAAAALAAYDPPTQAELTSALAALNDLSAANIRDLIIEDQGGGVSLGCAISVVLAYASGDLATTTGTSTYKDPSGTETRSTGVASVGNRSAAITCPTY